MTLRSSSALVTALVAFLLAGCELFSGGDSAARKYWLHTFTHPDSILLSSDTVAMTLDGDVLTAYRLWNGCYRYQTRAEVKEMFYRPLALKTQIVRGSAGDTLRLIAFRKGEFDSLEQDTISMPQLEVDCLTETPAGKITVVRSGLDAGTYSQSVGIDVTVDYEYTPHQGATWPYSLSLDLFENGEHFRSLGENLPLTEAKGRATIHVDGIDMPEIQQGPKSYAYQLSIQYLRFENDHRSSSVGFVQTPLIPAKVVYKPDP